jgi:hypothetical protein
LPAKIAVGRGAAFEQLSAPPRRPTVKLFSPATTRPSIESDAVRLERLAIALQALGQVETWLSSPRMKRDRAMAEIDQMRVTSRAAATSSIEPTCRSSLRAPGAIRT